MPMAAAQGLVSVGWGNRGIRAGDEPQQNTESGMRGPRAPGVTKYVCVFVLVLWGTTRTLLALCKLLVCLQFRT